MSCPIKSNSFRAGFTLTELMVSVAAVSILTLGFGVYLANGQKSWNTLYARTNSDAITDGFAVQKVFDSVCRKASLRYYKINDAGDSLQVYYWDISSTADLPENYALFYLSNNEMFVKHGKLKPGTWQDDITAATRIMKLAKGVQKLKFTVQGQSIQLYMTYVDSAGTPVICSTVRHNN